MTDEEKIIAGLLLAMESAIKSGDWKVDDACDPDYVMLCAEQFLRNRGYSRDGLTGEEFVEVL